MFKHILNKKTTEDTAALFARRHFMQQMAYGSLLAMGAPGIAQAAKSRMPTHKALAFHSINTGEKIKLTYFEKGRYIKPALKEINHVLRDHRSGDVHPIDTALLDQLYDLQTLLGLSKPFHIISAYRSPITNAQRHHESSGVASHSLHMEGRAVDIRIEGVSTRNLRNVALTMRRGGVGYYAESNFIHLDSGVFRTW